LSLKRSCFIENDQGLSEGFSHFLSICHCYIGTLIFCCLTENKSWIIYFQCGESEGNKMRKKHQRPIPLFPIFVAYILKTSLTSSNNLVERNLWWVSNEVFFYAFYVFLTDLFSRLQFTGRESMCVFVFERVSVCVCASVCVCLSQWERKCVCVSSVSSLCAWEGECVWEKERKVNFQLISSTFQPSVFILALATFFCSQKSWSFTFSFFPLFMLSNDKSFYEFL